MELLSPNSVHELTIFTTGGQDKCILTHWISAQSIIFYCQVQYIEIIKIALNNQITLDI
jgi:hypothetical protein